MATKSQVPVAMSSTALRCTSMFRPPSNQVTSTPNHFPHCSAVSLPDAHQVDPRPQLENAAFSFLPKGNWLLPEAPELLEDERQPARRPNPSAAAPVSTPRRVHSSVQWENAEALSSFLFCFVSGTCSRGFSDAIDWISARNPVRAPESLYHTSGKRNIFWILQTVSCESVLR